MWLAVKSRTQSSSHSRAHKSDMTGFRSLRTKLEFIRIVLSNQVSNILESGANSTGFGSQSG